MAAIELAGHLTAPGEGDSPDHRVELEERTPRRLYMRKKEGV